MPAPEPLQTAFERGALELKGQFTLGSNYTFLVTITHEDQVYEGVYKPQKGEQPLWDFPENSLSGREVAAYLLCQAIGWNFIPYTTFRQDGPFGPGSLQQFIDHNPRYHFFNFKPADKDLLRPVVIFDLIANNADRKGSHIFFQKGNHRLYAIDHGLCFNEEPKLRTVIWDYAGEALPPELCAALEALLPRISPPSSLQTELSAFLNPAEIAALRQRIETLLAQPTFPHPPEDRRAFPYPPL